MKFLLSVIIGLLAAVGTDNLYAAQTLRFAPTDGTAYTVRSLSIREQWANQTRMSLDSTTSTAKATLIKAADGYRVDAEIQKYWGKRDSQTLDERFLKVMTGLRTALEIDANGEATAVLGYDSMYVRIDSMFDFSSAKALKDIVSPPLMADKEMNDWNGRMYHLVGRQFILNALRLQMVPQMLPDGSSHTLYELSFITDTIRSGGKLQARVRIISDTNPQRLAASMDQTIEFLAGMFKVAESVLVRESKTASNYRMETNMVVDANTLMPDSERTTKEITLKQIDLPEQQVFSRVYETIDKKYTYTNR